MHDAQLHSRGMILEQGHGSAAAAAAAVGYGGESGVRPGVWCSFLWMQTLALSFNLRVKLMGNPVSIGLCMAITSVLAAHGFPWS